MSTLLEGLDPAAQSVLERASVETVLPGEWNDRLKSITDRVLSEVPAVGFVIGLLVNQLWPDSQTNIWELVKDQVQELIDRAILARVLDERKEDINGLRNSMRNYDRPLSKRERGYRLIGMLEKCDDLKAHLSDPATRIHSLPLAVIAAQIHVSLLRERLLYGSDLELGGTPGTLEDREAHQAWQADLNNELRDYRNYFHSTFLEWRIWRNGKIKVTQEHRSGLNGGDWTHVIDELNESNDRFAFGKNFDPMFTNILKSRIMADADAGMTQVLSPTFDFHRYSPPHKDFPAAVDPYLFDIHLGPYSDATTASNQEAIGRGADFWTTNVEDQQIAKATKVLVRNYNSIDAMQVHYGLIAGHFVGNPNGGTPDEFSAPSGINGVRIRFTAQWILWGLQFLSGETTSPIYGMRNFGPNVQLPREVLLDSSFKLCGAAYRQENISTGHGQRPNGIRTLKLRFRHKDYLSDGTIRSADSNNLFDVRGASSDDGVEIILHAPNGGTNQRWSRLYAGDDLWIVFSSSSGKVLSLDTSTNKIVQRPFTNITQNERWKFEKKANDNWRILSQSGEKALAAVTQGSGLLLRAEPASEQSNQLWKLS